MVDWDSANKSDRQLYGKFFHAMLDEGVYLAPSQFEAGFISLAHTDELLDRTVEAARKAARLDYLSRQVPRAPSAHRARVLSVQDELARTLLSNPVIEDFSVRLG